MRITLDDYRCKLINKILFASSLENVKRYIDTAMRSLNDHKVHGHVITRFVEKTCKNLEDFRPNNTGMQQWANVHYAKAQFSRLKEMAKANESF